MGALSADLHTLPPHSEAQTLMDTEDNTHKSRLAVIQTSITRIEMMSMRNVGHTKISPHCLPLREREEALTSESNAVTRSKQV